MKYAVVKFKNRDIIVVVVARIAPKVVDGSWRILADIFLVELIEQCAGVSCYEHDNQSLGLYNRSEDLKFLRVTPSQWPTGTS